MIKKGIYISLFFGLSVATYGQTIVPQLQNSFGGTADDYQQIIKNETSSQFWLVGSSHSNSNGNHTGSNQGGSDYWMVKLDGNLQQTFNLNIGGSSEDALNSAFAMGNQLILAGTSSSPVSGDKTSPSYGADDIWVVSTDTSGTLLWQENYGGSSNEGTASIVHYSDTSALLVCSSASGISGNKTTSSIAGLDLWIVEIALSDGHIIRQETIGSTGDDYTPDIAVLPGGTILIAAISDGGISGQKTDPGFGGGDIWLLELDNNFNVLRDKCFGGTAPEELTDAIHLTSSGLYLTAVTYSSPSGTIVNPTYTSNGTSDIWTTQLDNSWNIVWEKSFGGTQNETNPTLVELSDHRMYLSCSSNSNSNTGNKTAAGHGQYDTWGVLLQGGGTMLMQECFGGSLNDDGQCLKYIGDTLVLVASSSSPVSGNKTVNTNGALDTWVGILDFTTFLSVGETNVDQWNSEIYPNPFSESFQLNGVNFNDVDVFVVDQLGRKQELILLGDKLHVPASKPGIYHLIVKEKTSGKMYSSLVVKQ